MLPEPSLSCSFVSRVRVRAQEYNDKNNVDIIPIVDCKVGICATL